MFAWRWNRVDENFWRENRKKNFFGVCLIGWKWRKINSRVHVFSLGPPKSFLPKMERKLNGDEFFLDWQKCPYACAHELLQVAFIFFSSLPCCLFFSFFFGFIFGQWCFFFLLFFLFSRPRHPSSSSFFFHFWAVKLPFFFSFSFDFLGSGHDTSFFYFY